ncbi:MAG: ATP-binding protein [Gemmatimonadetes bacterium]|nr:ATP-binding protein [Gemmatimonadota bacterium]MYF72136.1 ATP-binding protein [Gemmatimonadota bacterium]MYK51832.1 ATP-binding protein [Gemmatimonadota bacterium]
MNIDSIHFKGHSCFKKEWAGFDTLKPINVIIGRNNSGKSHLLDLIEALCVGLHNDQGWQYRCSGVLDEESLRSAFLENHIDHASGRNHWQVHGRHFVDIPITWEVDANRDISNMVFPDDFNLNSPYGESSTNARLSGIKQVLQNASRQFNYHSFRRLLADRDIKTESATANLTLEPDGNGATNIVQRFLHTANEEFPEGVIKRELLEALNFVFGNDGEFSEITMKVHDDEKTDGSKDHWEIYLREDKKGLIPLSKSGSGLKTILLVLLNLLVVPKAKIEENRNKSDFVFAFEELENNLHPALLRRLFQYIEEYATNEKTHIFLTTHSSTALDFFSVSKNAQIIHVLHDGESARTIPISAHFDRLGVVSELGAKPSDLLQANGIVWVEGPSDRIYLNRWIDLYSDGRFQEGRDYQCAFYGGSLLARTQFKAPEEAETDLVNLLQVNPNIIVVCDGDQTDKDSDIKGRVKRINREVKTIPDAHIWITSAKEIENYIPGSVLEKALDLSGLRDPEQYENFFPRKKACSESYIEANLKKRNVDKVDLARSSVPHMTNDIMADRFDWKEQMKEIVARIKSWNT